MDTILIEVAKQVPSLVVLALLTRWFLNYMRSRDTELLEHDTKRDKALGDTLKHIGDDCHLVQRDSIEIMREVKEELGRSRQANENLIAYLQKFEQKREAS